MAYVLVKDHVAYKKQHEEERNGKLSMETKENIELQAIKVKAILYESSSAASLTQSDKRRTKMSKLDKAMALSGVHLLLEVQKFGRGKPACRWGVCS